MKCLCYSVRLKSLTEYSEKCLKASDWQGNNCFIPKSQYFGIDYEVQKSDAYWISAWLVDKENFNLMVSTKKVAWFDKSNGKKLPTFTIEKHQPEKVEAVENNIIQRLKKWLN